MKTFKEYITEEQEEQESPRRLPFHQGLGPRGFPGWFMDAFGGLGSEAQNILHDALIGTHAEWAEDDREVPDPEEEDKPTGGVSDLLTHLTNTLADVAAATSEQPAIRERGPLRLTLNPDGSRTLTNQTVEPDEVLAPRDWGSTSK